MAVGPSTSQTPSLVPTNTSVSFTSILSAGDTVAGSTGPGGTPYRMVGVPDGLGAYDNGNGTFTVLMDHEIGPTLGAVRAHGSAGAFVSQLIIDKQTLKVVSAGDLGRTVFLDADGDGIYSQGTTAFNRLCSADLPAISAFFDSATGLGTQTRIFMNGEEAGAEGRAFAWIVSGSESGRVYELPRLGKFSWENSVANPTSGAKTLVIGTDDATPGQLYAYVGNKQSAGTEVDKAGLTNGALYGIRVPAFTTETNATTVAAAGTPFVLQEMGPNGNVARFTGAQLQAESAAEGVTEFLRPEDGAWDPTNGNRFYFVTTNGATAPSRLWALDFTDAKNPLAGGTLKLLLEGNEGQVMFDNMTVGPDGKLILQEDPGNNARLSKVWQYDPATDSLSQIAEHDPARFSGLTSPFTQDEESSGAIDVTSILGSPGKQAFLLDVQAHYAVGDPTIVEGGQLLAMFLDTAVQGTSGNDTLTGSRADDALFGREGTDRLVNSLGNDLFDGGPGTDTLAFGSRFTDVHFGGTASTLVFSGPQGTDTVRGIERFEFTDGAIVNDATFLGRLDTAGSSAGVSLVALYDGLLGRTPDAKGFATLSDALDKGASLTAVANAMINSPEYTAKNGPISAETNKGFVDELYGVVLGRAPDTVGESNYVNLLDTGRATRADVALAFATSSENLGQVSGAVSAGVFVPDAEASAVARLYYGLLDRAPDVGGLNAYRSGVESGKATFVDVATSMLSSGEYGRANAGLSNSDYVKSLFDHALDRTADTAGLAGYVNQLDTGAATRAQVAVDIVQSAEAYAHFAPVVELGWHLA